MVQHSLQAAQNLSKDGISAEVIDLRTIAPWDHATVLESVARTKRAAVVHEAVQQFGIGAEIAAVIGLELFRELRAPVHRIGAPTCPVPFSKPLEDAYVPSPARIEAVVRSMMS